MEVTAKVRLRRGELTRYLEENISQYARICRQVYRKMIEPTYCVEFKDERAFRKWVANEFEITTRQAYTIINEIKGRLASRRGHEEWLLKTLYQEEERIDSDIATTEKQVARLKEKARENRATEKELERLRRKKSRLYRLKNKRNKKRQKIERIKEQLASGTPFRIGFGGRERFKKQFHLKENGFKNHEEWYDYYCFYRDHNLATLGSAAESSGNQLSTLIYNSSDGTFSLRFRKMEKGIRGKERYIIVERLKIPYLKDTIKEVARKTVSKPLFHRFVRSPKGWYLHISYDLDCPERKESGYSGFCGLDYNDGFIELAACDLRGNLVYQEHIGLKHHGTGNAAKTEMAVAAKHIVDLCLERNWELKVEDLDFETTKARQSKGQSESEKHMNKVVHALDYHRYKEFLERACRKAGLKIEFVPPEYTSKNGLEKFGESKKLNRHQAAAYYISRDEFEERETFSDKKGKEKVKVS